MAMPLIALVPFILMCVLWRRRIGHWGDTFLFSAIAYGVLVIAITEFLSRFDWITRTGLTIAWLTSAVLVVLVTPLIPKFQIPVSPPARDWIVRFAVIYLSAVAATSAVVAWIGPPSNTDSMTYHLARVVHWIQDRNVDFYPVQYYPPDQYPLAFFRCQQVRQLVMPPGAEYIVLNLQLLSGSERWSNLVQCFAYVGCLIGVWSVAGLLGTHQRGQALAALVAGTLPIACMEAVTTQNDLVCTFWLICFVWTTLRIWKRAGNPSACALWFNLLFCGLSLGLALLTKATAYIYAAPFVIGLLGILFTQRGLRGLGLGACVALAAICVNLPTYCRNYDLFGMPIGDAHDDLVYSNSPISVGFTVSNIIRNTALEFAFPPGHAPVAVEHAARALHRVLGLDPEDPRSTFPLTTFDLSNYDWDSEDNAPNPFHVILFAAALISLALGRPRNRPTLVYMLGILLAMLAFCAYLRWQPWHTRLHLDLLVMSAPAIGLVLERWNRILTAAIALLLSVAAVIWIACNIHHPFFGPRSIFSPDQEARRFILRPAWQKTFEQVAALAANGGYRQVGLIFTDDDWEYPLAAMIQQRNPQVRIETFAQPWTLQPHTRNHGWDENLKPYLVVKFDHNMPVVVRQAMR